MKSSNLRLESLNTMTVEINGLLFRIHGDAEISQHESKKSIPAALKADTMAEVIENLSFYNRTLKSTA